LDATNEGDRGFGVPAWVVGASGLLGSAVCRALTTARTDVVTKRVPWSDPEAAVQALLDQAEQLPQDGWWLAWCAGTGVIASAPEDIEQELRVLREFFGRWHPARGRPGTRAMFFPSSAGGVYAGSADPPFSETSEPLPLAAYGRAKLEAETIVRDFARRTGTPLLIGRIGTLFGPGQNLDKPQGLVSQLCKAHTTGQPLSIYVPLDTMRDYLYVDDAAAMIVGGLRAVAATGTDGIHLKLLVSGRSVTVNEILGEVRRVTRHRPPIVTQKSAVSRMHVTDLRLRSTAWPHLDQYASTSLGAGIGACLEAVKASLRCPKEGNR
jgi:UDP-glucose 4-epimerase